MADLLGRKFVKTFGWRNTSHAHTFVGQHSVSYRANHVLQGLVLLRVEVGFKMMMILGWMWLPEIKKREKVIC